MIEFARVCDSVAETPAKSLKIARLAEYFRALEPDDLAAAARFLAGSPLGAGDKRRVGTGASTLLAAARKVWELDEVELGEAFRETGDLGEAVGRQLRDPVAPSLFEDTLGPASLARILGELAKARGASAGKKRALGCERILRACRTEREAVYAIKIVAGELRIGLREGLVIDALAAAFGREAAAVRRAAMAAGDVGAVALACREGTLGQIEVRYGSPIGFMLASPLAFGSSYRELLAGAWLVEDKYDGIRAQAHKRGTSVRLFSRTFSEISRAFPEVVEAVRAQPGDFIIDGEITARRDGRSLPFRYLQPRLQRIDPPAQMLAEVPVAFVAFDLLARENAFLIDAPLLERRAALSEVIVPQAALEIGAGSSLEPGSSNDAIHALFENARLRGNEGLVLKRTDAPYAPGRRGRWWFKLKRELSTLDCVVIGVEWGHGKRAKVLSDYTFAVRRAPGDDVLLAIGKAYTGLTDAEIAEMTEWFLAHRIGPAGRRVIAVEPAIVIEVAFDIIQKSTLHPSGYALRFPRIARLRLDKFPSEADTLAGVERIYREMLAREGVSR